MENGGTGFTSEGSHPLLSVSIAAKGIQEGWISEKKAGPPGQGRLVRSL
jgi:hypothetical protein